MDITQIVDGLIGSNHSDMNASLKEARDNYIQMNDALALYCLRLLHLRKYPDLERLNVEVDLTTADLPQWLRMIVTAYNETGFVSEDPENTAKVTEDARGWYIYFKKHSDLRLYAKVNNYCRKGITNAYRSAVVFFFVF